jgi:hypothetical protein
VSAQCPISATAYGYAPSLSVNATLLTAFSLIAVVQLIQGVAWKTLTATLLICHIINCYDDINLINNSGLIKHPFY